MTKYYKKEPTPVVARNQMGNLEIEHSKKCFGRVERGLGAFRLSFGESACPSGPAGMTEPKRLQNPKRPLVFHSSGVATVFMKMLQLVNQQKRIKIQG